MQANGEGKRFGVARLGLWLAFASAVAALFLYLRACVDLHRFFAFGLFPALVAVLMVVAIWVDRRLTRGSRVLGVAKWLLGFGLLWLLGALAFYGLFLWLTYSPRLARKQVCRNTMNELVSAMQTYTAEASDCFPPAARWREALVPVLKSQGIDVEVHIRCPEAHSEASYAFNRSLSRLTSRALTDPERTVLVLETDTGTGWDAAGGPELLPDEPRHFRGDNYGFADGHLQWIRRKQLGTDSGGNPIWAKEPDADWVIWEPVLKEPEQGSHD